MDYSNRKKRGSGGGGETKKEEEEGSVTLHDEMYIPDDDADRRDR